MSAPVLLVNEHCRTGENPFYIPEENSIYWTDIPNGKMFRYELATGAHRQIYSGPPVGGFTLQEDGKLLLFRVNDIATLDHGGNVQSILQFSAPDMDRFNDVIADPEGRVFACTMSKIDGRAGVFRVERDGKITPLFLGTRTANGMGFSPDLRTFYWTDTTHLKIFRFDYDRARGEISNRSLFYDAANDGGKPDGMAVDEHGDVWSARWDGGGIVQIDARGKFVQKISLPVKKTSACRFGGEEMRSLFITTAGGEPDSGTLDGALFKIEPGVRGKPEFRS